MVVSNAHLVAVTGKKAEDKVYRSHTGYPGGLRTLPFRNMLRDTPEKVKMLPAK